MVIRLITAFVFLLLVGCESFAPVDRIKVEDAKVKEKKVEDKTIEPGKTVCPVKCPILTVAGMRVIGEVEHITFLPPGLNLTARIDTGATTSSLGVAQQQLFERDGESWVRFSVRNPGDKKLIEFRRPITRKTIVKGPDGLRQSRVVVSLKVRMGDLMETTEFTLSGRDNYKYPVLIGRSLLRGNAVVDVGQKFLLSSGGEG
jgi:hypothetical protein